MCTKIQNRCLDAAEMALNRHCITQIIYLSKPLSAFMELLILLDSSAFEGNEDMSLLGTQHLFCSKYAAVLDFDNERDYIIDFVC